MHTYEVKQYLPLVRAVANRMAMKLPRSCDVDDLVGAGVLGLINATRQFDQSKGVPFDRYAEIRIRGAILDELRSLDSTSRSVRRKTAEITDTIRFLSTRLGRAPMSEEIAEAMSLSIDQYNDLVSTSSPVLVLGFDDLGIHNDDDKRDMMQYIRDPSAADPATKAVFADTAARLAAAIELLTDRQRQVVTLYYYEGLSFTEVAQLLGLTEGRVSQLHTAAMGKLKDRVSDVL